MSHARRTHLNLSNVNNSTKISIFDLPKLALVLFHIQWFWSFTVSIDKEFILYKFEIDLVEFGSCNLQADIDKGWIFTKISPRELTRECKNYGRIGEKAQLGTNFGLEMPNIGLARAAWKTSISCGLFFKVCPS